jgi:hypothetical protein
MSNQITTPAISDEQRLANIGRGKAIFWSIFSGILFGALIGTAVGIFMRPKEELTELSQEWLEDLKDVTEHVSDTVRAKVDDLVSRRREPTGRYEEYPGSYV